MSRAESTNITLIHTMVDRRLAYRMFRMPTQGISGRIYHLPAWKALELARRWPLILAERYARVRP